MQLIDYLASQLRSSATYNSAVQVAPAAILWTDIECQWQSAMPYIKQHLSELVELGEYKPDQRIGPAIWIKCAIAGLLEDCELPKDKTPIIYLPGVGRKDLRAIEQCPDELRPLAELQYRGCWWAYNTAGRDWSVGSFLTNPRVGLELDVAKDRKTQEAILNILPDLLETPDEALKGKKLEAQDFNSIVMEDPAKDILSWLNDPKDKKHSWADRKWAAFQQTCTESYDFNPESSDVNQVLFKLCEAESEWSSVWQRFVDTAHNLPSLVSRLSTIQPDGLAFEASHFLSENDKDENELAKALSKSSEVDASTLKDTILSLYEQHKERKSWLWYKLDRSPWLTILEQLAEVVEHTNVAFTGPSVEQMAETYKERFWRADAAAINAMAVAKKDSNREQIVADILAVIYTPWLEKVALNFQNLVRTEGYPGNPGKNNEVNESTAAYNVGGQVVFFVDGLRFDTAKALQEKLDKSGLSTTLTTNWCALPSLTATAKAAVTPVGDLLDGAQENDNFTPKLKDSTSEFGSYQFKKALKDKGWQYLEGLETGEPNGNAWVQTGDLDNMGHDQQLKMPRNIDVVLDDVVARVTGLFEAGWKNIRIVTDHGWLWVPDKLKDADISKNVVKKRLARCAILKDNVDTSELKVPWHWNENVSVAMAPGIAGYVGGDYYNHGGLSLQECLTPVININKP